MTLNTNHCDQDIESRPDQTSAAGGDDCLAAVNENAERVQGLLDQLQDKDQFDDLSDWSVCSVDEDAIDAVDENIRLRDKNEQLADQIRQLENQVADLESQNAEPGSREADHESGETQAPNTDARLAQPSPAQPTESLSWDERKLQILEQLENDSFDAEAFLTTLKDDHPETRPDDAPELIDIQDAVNYINDLHDQLGHLQSEIQQRDSAKSKHESESQALRDQIDHLQREAAQYEQDSAPKDAIVLMLDSDEIVQQERENLRRIQEECEEKLRSIEIETSLERAKLARERTELEQTIAELESQLKALQRQAGIKDGSNVGTRWMAKLGLTGDRNH